VAQTPDTTDTRVSIHITNSGQYGYIRHITFCTAQTRTTRLNTPRREITAPCVNSVTGGKGLSVSALGTTKVGAAD